MYRILRITALTALLISGLVRPTWGGLAEDQYAIAAHHYSQQRWEFAVAEFTEFLVQYPDHDRAENVRFFLAESLIQLRRYQDAHQRFAEYLQSSPEGKYHQQCLFRLGETLYLDGQHQRAREYLERFAREHGEDNLCGYALPYLGEIHLAAGDPDAAHEAFEQGLQRFPSGPLADQCRFGLARALEAQGDPDGAMRFYRYLGESEQRTSVTEDAVLRMGILLYQQERFDEAVEVVGRHRERYPGS
jgi:TolA-binding protein